MLFARSEILAPEWMRRLEQKRLCGRRCHHHQLEYHNHRPNEGWVRSHYVILYFLNNFSIELVFFFHKHTMLVQKMQGDVPENGTEIAGEVSDDLKPDNER